MARRRFSVPICLLGLVATTVAAACTDEFDSCKETRTCTPTSVAGGAAGSPPAEGDAGELAASQGGLAPQGGEGGTSAATAAFAVVSSLPETEQSEVARDTAVTVTFSSPIDADTVSSDSFRLVGPDGPVVGTLDVNGSDVVFAPAAPLAVFTSYEIQLSTALASSDGAELEDEHAIAFRTRDGVFGKPKRLTSAQAINLAVQGTPSGHILVSWMDGLTPQSRIVTFFNPLSGTWSAAGPVEMKTDADYGSGCVALNDKGDAFAVLGHNTPPVWNRAKDGVWGVVKPTPQTVTGSCALADDGTAMSLWDTSVDNDRTVLAASLSSEDDWSTPETLHIKARAAGLIRYGLGFLAFHALEGSGLVASEYDPQLGWLPAKPVIEPGTDYNYWSYAAFSPAALMTWNGPGSLAVNVSSFDGKAWSTHELGPGRNGTNASISAGGRLAAWLNQGSAYVVRGGLDGTWHDPVKLGATNAEVWGPAVSIDSSGNALAAWPNGSSISWRRSVDGSMEWSDVEEMPDQDPSAVFSRGDSSGNVMLIWQNPLGVWASRFE